MKRARAVYYLVFFSLTNSLWAAPSSPRPAPAPVAPSPEQQAVEHYNKGGTPNKNLSDKIKKLNLTEQDKKDLVEFMKACTGSFPKVETGRLPK